MKLLFACSQNAVRSPMAGALMARLEPGAQVESAGVRVGELDPLVVAVMAEIGIELGAHQPRRFEDLKLGTFDLIITLSPEAQHKAVEMTRAGGTPVEYWPTMDPTAVDGSREQRLGAYRAVRDGLLQRLKQRFSTPFQADT